MQIAIQIVSICLLLMIGAIAVYVGMFIKRLQGESVEKLLNRLLLPMYIMVVLLILDIALFVLFKLVF